MYFWLLGYHHHILHHPAALLHLLLRRRLLLDPRRRSLVVFLYLDAGGDGAADAEDDRTEEDEKNANKSPMSGPGPLTSFFVARAHVAGLPGFARIAFVLFVRIGVFPDVAGLAGLDELVRHDFEVVPNWCARPMFDVFSFRAAPAAGRVPVFPWDIPRLSFTCFFFLSAFRVDLALLRGVVEVHLGTFRYFWYSAC